MRCPGVLLLAMLGGCSLGDDFYFVPDDTGALDSGAASDTGLADTFRPPVDMGVETAPPLAGCAALSGFEFCSDFDAVPAVHTNWGGTPYTTGASSITLDTARSHSPGKSMKTSLAATTMTTGAANLHRDFAPATLTRPFAADFWVYFDSIPTTDGPFVIKIAGRNSNRGVTLYVGEGGFAVDANAPSGTTNHKSGPIAAGKWLHVRLEASLSATASGWFKLYVDDMKTPAVARTGLATTTVEDMPIRVNLGFYADRTPAIVAWFDDFAFYWL